MVIRDKTARSSRRNGGNNGVARSAVDLSKSMHLKRSAAEKADQDTNGHDQDARSQRNLEAPPEGLVKHIHPCLCDLTAEQLRRIQKHHEEAARLQRKFELRVRQIEEELARLEEERLERERELQEQDELFGDEYEMIGKKKKRKRRAARRASMVSLGVRQVINWRKEPRIKVRYNQTYKLRSENNSYCSFKKFYQSPVREIRYNKVPNIPVRVTKTHSLRATVNGLKHKDLIAKEDKRPLFLAAFWY